MSLGGALDRATGLLQRTANSVRHHAAKSKRSQVMSRIRGHGDKETELALIKLFRLNGITGWRRHWPLFGKPGSCAQRVEGRKLKVELVRDSNRHPRRGIASRGCA